MKVKYHLIARRFAFKESHVEVAIEFALVHEADRAEHCISLLQDKVVGVHVEDGHASHPDNMLLHRVLHAHLTSDSLQNHFKLFFYFLFII